MDFGRKIREIREKKDYSQDSVADTAGIDRQHWGKIERGESQPTWPVAEKMILALEVSLAEFFESKVPSGYKSEDHRFLHDMAQGVFEADKGMAGWLKQSIELAHDKTVGQVKKKAKAANEVQIQKPLSRIKTGVV